ncbi:MAG: hypothetical protein BWY28_03242 [bacterium ADurb.Bin236]|nr:MAG: hypothetical protein BWY28_03242 [bacterium ADurb.Bin236]
MFFRRLAVEKRLHQRPSFFNAIFRDIDLERASSVRRIRKRFETQFKELRREPRAASECFSLGFSLDCGDSSGCLSGRNREVVQRLKRITFLNAGRLCGNLRSRGDHKINRLRRYREHQIGNRRNSGRRGVIDHLGKVQNGLPQNGCLNVCLVCDHVAPVRKSIEDERHQFENHHALIRRGVIRPFRGKLRNLIHHIGQEGKPVQTGVVYLL